MTTWVDAGGRLVDRDAVLAELHPPLERVAGESPASPAQREAHARWEAWAHRRAEKAARIAADQVAEADAFIAYMEQKERERLKRERAAAGRAYQRARRSSPGPHSWEAA